MTMAHSIGNYFMIPVYILCIALFYPVSGETVGLIHNVTAQGVYGEEAVLTCILKKTAKANIHWIFEGNDFIGSTAESTTPSLATTTEAAITANGSTTSTEVTEAAEHDTLTTSFNDTAVTSTSIEPPETTDSPSSITPSFNETKDTSISTTPSTTYTTYSYIRPKRSLNATICADNSTLLTSLNATADNSTLLTSLNATADNSTLLTTLNATADNSTLLTSLNATADNSTLLTSLNATADNSTLLTSVNATADNSTLLTTLNEAADISPLSTPLTENLETSTAAVAETSETNSGTTTTDKPPSRYKTALKGNQFILKIANATEVDALNYTCVAEGESRPVYLNLSFPGKFLAMEPSTDPIVFELLNLTYENSMLEEDRKLNLTCVFEVYNETEVEWIIQLKGGNKTLKGNTTRHKKKLISTYTTKMHLKMFDEQNGRYFCRVRDPVTGKILSGKRDVKIIAAPSITINFTKPVSSSEIFFNWTVKNFNSEIRGYELSYRNSTTLNYQFIQNPDEKINATANYYVLRHLSSNTTYILRLRVKTFNDSEVVEFSNTTLAKDPDFIPNISINGFTARSMTIGMSTPPPDVAEYVHYYVLQVWKKNDQAGTTKEAMHYRDESNLPYMFNDLNPHTTYVFKAKACFEFGDEFKFQKCGDWSNEMEALTMDGIPSAPTNVTMHCGGSLDQGYHVNITWDAPTEPNAEIKGYMMELTGNSSYIDRFGQWKLDTFGPLSKFLTNVTFFTRVTDLKPNMNYTARLMALTRSRRRGQEAVVYNGTERAPPDSPPRPRWRKIEEKDGQGQSKYSLRVLVPRVSERNGPVCCYRVYLVQLPKGKGWIPTPPQDLPVITRELPQSAKYEQEGVGAYVTDIFDHKHYPPGEIPLGDKHSLRLPRDDNATCARCFEAPQRHEPPTTTTTARVVTTTDEFDDDVTDMVKTKRSAADTRENEFKPQDPVLNPNYNYTLFVELIPLGAEHPPLYSGCTQALNTDTPAAIAAANTMETALQICCGVAAFLLLATLIFCVVHTRRARKQPPRHAHVELNPIQAALRYVVGHIGGRTPLVSAPPPDLPPIALEELAAAYAERQADSDYGFQKEFELLQMLPECYPDRTTHASEARENQPKNRYPDIKAYDQTRVKLQQIDGITGSDYINANYVMGYKEHKQFICAQGPTDTTVNDFWRMIWEGGLELIVMLTNLEEYSKVKCSKYWPDEDRGSRAFGSITVHHVSEKRYSDYIVRELKIVKQPTNSDGQPIVENNGVAKRNGDCKDAESGSVPTSPREVKENNARIVRQYHFLMWKDFAAPEHPQSILKFIKRMNEAWSHLMGRPVVVHCSAGVGRTGTLVALDCLLEQLRNTRRAAVFTTVAELRRQRNFLVQSLKQYVFVYRALVEYAHYGDTEIPASRLKSAIDRLRNTPEGADKCLMEHEFEKMMNPPVSEPLKSWSAGSAEEARARNRSPDCLPYDRNRVILAPAPPANYSTYINASFIEAYDNSEGYIITQDPLPNTITDFWRMVSEHNVATIVMLSELGEGKCPRYWDDGTAQYDHISVQYEESESCPYYTRRQFRVTNNKSGDVTVVRQLQYHGWPTAPGHVPEVTRGLAELADAARADSTHHPAMVLHCQYGTERSALFAALCILICALRTEHRVDVAATARKVRSQRAGTINTFLQYEFLHRAILNYAELHNLLEDS